MKLLKKWWFWIIVVILIIIIVVILTLKTGTICGYNRGTSCPSNSKDCSCIGIKINEYTFVVPWMKPVGGKSKYYCLGKCYGCRCYEEGCPVRTGYKKEMDCNSINKA